jgi:hypothetical protein
MWFGLGIDVDLLGDKVSGHNALAETLSTRLSSTKYQLSEKTISTKIFSDKIFSDKIISQNPLANNMFSAIKYSQPKYSWTKYYRTKYSWTKSSRYQNTLRNRILSWTKCSRDKMLSGPKCSRDQNAVWGRRIRDVACRYILCVPMIRYLLRYWRDKLYVLPRAVHGCLRLPALLVTVLFKWDLARTKV